VAVSNLKPNLRQAPSDESPGAVSLGLSIQLLSTYADKEGESLFNMGIRLQSEIVRGLYPVAAIASMKLDHLVGQKVGSSTLLREIARGGMSAVFAAYQHTLKRQIAVKILPKDLITPTTAQIFTQEAEAAAILSHPNIIPIYEVGDAGEFLFFTMQLVRGRALSDYIAWARKNVLPSRRTLPIKTTIRIITTVLDALDYAHSQEIIHRDIKPGNILIEAHTNRPIVTDFGVAQVSRNPDEGSSMIVGTPLYMPPEQIMNPEVDGRADIYATATTMLEMFNPESLLTGPGSIKELFRLKLERKDGFYAKRPSEMNPLLNQEMDRIIAKALSYEPETRYQTCQAFREDLERYVDRHLRN
jgi:serine/threonine protein kinase